MAKLSPFAYVILIIVLSVVGVSAIIILQITGSDETNQIGIMILSFLAPTILSIIAMMVKDVHTDINGRMTELMQKTDIAAHAEGKAEGKAEARNREDD